MTEKEMAKAYDEALERAKKLHDKIDIKEIFPELNESEDYRFNNESHYWPICYCDEECRLWTIEDAKDGDVLACNEEILLFKSYSVQGRISLYCWYNGQTNNFHDKEVIDTLLTKRNEICPATQKQCDLLFQKIKEAGYEWDIKKKELKKKT